MKARPRRVEDSGIKLASVASKVLGVSGRLMLEALVAGTHDPEVLAELARGRLRLKIPALREALEGNFRNHHRILVAELLAHVAYIDEAIARMSHEVESRIVPFSKEVELLVTIPGISRRTAEVLLAEIGADMSVFPTADHLASWAGLCPGNNESAGKHHSERTRKGSKWLRKAIVESASSTARTKDTYLAAQFARLKGRCGYKKAVVAVAHSLLVIVFHVLSRQTPYQDLGSDYFHRRDSEAHKNRLVNQLERLGFQVTVAPAA